MRQKKVRIIDVVASRLLEEFETLNEATAGTTGAATGLEGVDEDQGSSSKTDTLNWFVCFFYHFLLDKCKKEAQ